MCSNNNNNVLMNVYVWKAIVMYVYINETICINNNNNNENNINGVMMKKIILIWK